MCAAPTWRDKGATTLVNAASCSCSELWSCDGHRLSHVLTSAVTAVDELTKPAVKPHASGLQIEHANDNERSEIP
jgi:hypothetical protein